MGFFSKLLKVATGGLSGIPGAIARRDIKGIATGGMLGGGSRRTSLGAMQNAIGGLRGGAPVSEEAQSFFGQQSPEDQASIRGTWGNPGQMQQWYENAKAAGSVPAPTPVAPQIAQTAQAMAMSQAAPPAETPRQRAERQMQQQIERRRRMGSIPRTIGTPDQSLLNRQ